MELILLAVYIAFFVSKSCTFLWK